MRERSSPCIPVKIASAMSRIMTPTTTPRVEMVEITAMKS